MLSKLFKPKAPQPVKFEDGQTLMFRFAADRNIPKREISADAALAQVVAEIASLRAVVARHEQDRDVPTIQADIDRQRALLAVHTKDQDLAAGQVRTGHLTMTEANKVTAQRGRTHAGLSALLMELQRRVEGDEARAALDSLLAQVR